MYRFLLIILFLSTSLIVKAKESVTVDYVDIMRYQGTWYEIAKLPNWFQKDCEKNVTASYKLRDDGQLTVINRCEEKYGKISEIEGIAKVVDKETNAKLKVSFVRFLWKNWFWGDYWILGLAADYSWVILGGPDQKYGWILAREKQLDEETMNHINEILLENNYQPEKFVMTIQE